MTLMSLGDLSSQKSSGKNLTLLDGVYIHVNDINTWPEVRVLNIPKLDSAYMTLDLGNF